MGGKLEGMVNVPFGERVAFRAVAFYQHDAGYIDNIFGTPHLLHFRRNRSPDLTVTNAGLEKKNFNELEVYGGRAALKIDLNDNWTATPTFMYQKLKANGVFYLRSRSRRIEDRPFRERSSARTVSGRRR